MRRPAAGSLVASVLLALAVVEAGCGATPPEQQLLINFFRAARLRDNTTLGNIAAVSFNPRTEGIVEQFEIVAIGPERRRRVDLAALMDEEARERSQAVNSLTAPGQPDAEVSGLDVALVSKEVTVNARVRTPDGQTSPRTMVFTFERAVAGVREGRWLITGLR